MGLPTWPELLLYAVALITGWLLLQSSKGDD